MHLATSAVTISFLLLLSSPALAGSARVIDGDTIEWEGERVRLQGIDAPEMKQSCERDGVLWLCGKEARKALDEWVGDRDVDCVGDERDKYGRLLATCYVDGQDMESWMVSKGFAVAYYKYSFRYAPEEIQARFNGVGLWAGDFVKPEDWRRGERLGVSKVEPSGDCRIKGNVSSKGTRIYHVPGGKYYDQTQISSFKGERWFCSEREAKAAGWRRSRR